VPRATALCVGVGCGLFTDEAGKFITARNDYFTPLAPPIIYVFFLAVLGITVVARRPPPVVVEEPERRDGPLVATSTPSSSSRSSSSSSWCSACTTATGPGSSPVMRSAT